MSTMTIKQVQQILMSRGYDLGVGGADGDAGPKTIAALTAFQRTSGLLADGIVGKRTVEALKKSVDVQPTAPKPTVDPELPRWLKLARDMLGTHEGIGGANNPKVVALFADAGFPEVKQDSTAWCAAFVNAMLERSGIKGSRNLAARSFERWGVGLKEPAMGCVATKRRGDSKWQGHTFFVVGADKTHVFGLGGNQSDQVSVARFPKSEITSYRWPSSVAPPVGAKLPDTVAGATSGVREA